MTITRNDWTYDPDTGAVTHNGELVAPSDAYKTVAFEGKAHLLHHVAWFLYHGVWPTTEIDHRDRNTANNAIQNLREATRSQNLCNRRTFKNNTSGVKGVTWHSQARAWRFQIWENGKMRYWTCSHWFSAVCAAGLIRRTLHGEFACDSNTNNSKHLAQAA